MQPVAVLTAKARHTGHLQLDMLGVPIGMYLVTIPGCEPRPPFIQEQDHQLPHPHMHMHAHTHTHTHVRTHTCIHTHSHVTLISCKSTYSTNKCLLSSSKAATSFCKASMSVEQTWSRASNNSHAHITSQPACSPLSCSQ